MCAAPVALTVVPVQPGSGGVPAASEFTEVYVQTPNTQDFKGAKVSAETFEVTNT